MKAYEYYADVLSDGHLSIPENLKDKLKPESKVRITLCFCLRMKILFGTSLLYLTL